MQAGHHLPVSVSARCVELDKLEFIDPIRNVTFLCPNKKVTKEVVRGEALRANRILAPDPTPAAIATAH